MGSKFEWNSMIGQKYGMWVVLSIFEDKDKYSHVKVLCKCTCENQTEKIVFAQSLKNNKSTSCGCITKNLISENLKTHGMSSSKLYHVWNQINQRCTNKKDVGFDNYGGRGIKVCDEWRISFENFYKWSIENLWTQGLCIDRIDNDGDYDPNNCQWITQSKNNAIGKKRMNKRNSSGYNGVHLNKKSNKWVSQLYNGIKILGLGMFDNIEDAIEARINKEIELFGEQKTNLHYNRKIENNMKIRGERQNES